MNTTWRLPLERPTTSRLPADRFNLHLKQIDTPRIFSKTKDTPPAT
jgi:hypothetical protein